MCACLVNLEAKTMEKNKKENSFKSETIEGDQSNDYATIEGDQLKCERKR